MASSIPACFGRGGGGTQSHRAATGPCSTTAAYETHLGFAALTWSRTSLGLSLRVDLRLPCPSAPDFSSASSAEPAGFTTFRFRLRPLLLWWRRGSKRFPLKDTYRCVDFSWDLSRAVFPACGSPEPSSRFHLSIYVDGELLLAAGDLPPPAAKAELPTSRNPPFLASRTEHVVHTGSDRVHTTAVRFAGKQREVVIEIPSGERDGRMQVSFDGTAALQVKRLRWKFRGNERVELGGDAGGILVSWDVYSWLFPSKVEGAPAGVEPPATARVDLGYAVFVLRFDDEEERVAAAAAAAAGGNTERGLWAVRGENYGELSTCERRKGWRNRRSLLKTRSSSSASSVSSAGGSSVMEWASVEENELREAEGFTLLVYVWRR